jgi:DNA-directed RNA polymerase subunit beta
MQQVSYQRSQTKYMAPSSDSLQLEAYARFVQKELLPGRRKKMGLELLFSETFPIKSYDGSVSLEYLYYEITPPRYTPDECRDLKRTYGAPLKARLRLNKPEAIEETVYLGEIPLMIGGGEFVINGVERIVVSQLHRSPGVDFRVEKTGEKKDYSAWIIPQRGSWIEIAIGKKEIVFLKIDQGGKLPVTTFLRAMDESLSTNAQLINAFYKVEKINLEKDVLAVQDKYAAEDIIDTENNKTLLKAGEKITESAVRFLSESGIKSLKIITDSEHNLMIINTLAEDATKSHEEALQKIYQRLRPGMPIQLDRAKTVFHERFFDENRYQLGKVGRFRINRKFGLNIPETQNTVQKDDIIETTKYLIKVLRGEGTPDDIDDLGNRRVRTIDELATDEMRKGFLRMKRAITERLSHQLDPEITPRGLINSKMVSSFLEYFFERSELSQVVDQTNPIAQLTHERRLSALGPGGLNRKRAGFEVRDVHISHYGRICPIETPEGANIGLITSLGMYASLDKYGFLVTPYRKVEKGKISDDTHYLRADEEKDKAIASADAPIDQHNRLIGTKIIARINGEFHSTPVDKIEFIDVSPQQIIGLTASLIPFLEHDDANRALMGANMQRQAVPLMNLEQAFISTGIEKYAAKNSAMVVQATREGTVIKVTGDEIAVRSEEESNTDVEIYKLRKYAGSTERTCINQKAIVREGDEIKKGQVIADGPGICNAELSLGKNILIAFMPWEGYNFEDAIVVSERLIKENTFTSIHIEEFEAELRETKLGREEFTRDIPNISEKALKNLDEKGIIRVGTKVKPGDILVGKIAPKSKSELTPEEKLLHAIFGKAGEDVKNESLETPPGVEGFVIDTKHFARRLYVSEKEKMEVERKVKRIERDYYNKIELELAENIKPIEKITGKRLLPRPVTYGSRGTIKNISDLKIKLDLSEKGIEFSSRSEKDQVESRIQKLINKCERIENDKDNKVNTLMRGDDLPTGVQEMVRVKISIKRSLSVGDKLAGRHGNKGVVSKIVPEEDMPYMEDGTPVDIILNPLGVPSRMNVGQILETHLGLYAKNMNIRIQTPVFDGPTEQKINDSLNEIKWPTDGKIPLYDGRTGMPFKEKVMIGYAYIMKLNHLVDDKIHARAIGPYSLITQQPLGGKARYGGQRFGEMEVWALEAYGAAHTLQEMLTVKSDDVDGRTKIYESIIKGENTLEPNVPTSFEVLTNEIRGLCLSLKLEKDKKKSIL